jgi:DNA-binding SARP family transcriptional activator/predicted ATPase
MFLPVHTQALVRATPRLKLETGPSEARNTKVTSDVQVRLLGAFEVRVDGRLIDAAAWKLKHAKWLWQMLCLAPQHRLPKEEAIDALWPHASSPSAAANRLYHTLHALRALFADSGLTLDSPAVALTAGVLRVHESVQLQVDAAAFHAAAWQARQAVPGSQQAQDALRQAVELANGPLTVGAAADDWFTAQRQAQLREQAWVLEQWIGLQQQRGLPGAELMPWLKRLLDLEPVNEWAHRQLMEVHAAAGQEDLALQQYTACTRALRRGLGVEPTAATRALARRITQATSQASQEQAQQALSMALPRAAGELFGRKEELRQLQHWLVTERARLVTVVAGSGIGKTRLAQEAAHQLQAEIDGTVVLVHLGALSDADALASHVCLALGLSMSSGSAAETLYSTLANRRVLLVLDRFEHLLPASETVAQWLTKLPDLQLLLTSQLPLRLREERVLHLLALSEQDAAAAEQLLCHTALRASAQQPEREIRQAAARLCRLVAGNALAIELAGAALARMDTQALERELQQHTLQVLVQQRPRLADEPQHASLQRAIEWSATLLSAQSRELLALLSVFAGAFTTEDVEGVLGSLLQGQDALSALAPLLALHLLAHHGQTSEGQPQRYVLLDSVREFSSTEAKGLHRLTDTERAHAEYFGNTLRRVAQFNNAGKLREATDLYLRARQDFEVLTRWLIKHGSRFQVLFFAPDLAGLPKMFEGRSEISELLATALRITPQTPEEVLQSSTCYYCAAYIRSDECEHPDVLRLAKRAWHLACQTDRVWRKLAAGITLSECYAGSFQFWPAVRLMRRVIALYNHADEVNPAAYASLSFWLSGVGEFRQAAEASDLALAAAQRRGDVSGTLMALHGQARAERGLGRLHLAEQVIAEFELLQETTRWFNSGIYLRQLQVLQDRDLERGAQASASSARLRLASRGSTQGERQAQLLSWLIEAEAGSTAGAERLRASVHGERGFGGALNGEIFFATQAHVLGLNAQQGDWQVLLPAMATLSHTVKQSGNLRWATELNDAAVQVAHLAGQQALAQALRALSPRLLQRIKAQPTPRQITHWSLLDNLLQQPRSELVRRRDRHAQVPEAVRMALKEWATQAQSLALPPTDPAGRKPATSRAKPKPQAADATVH